MANEADSAKEEGEKKKKKREKKKKEEETKERGRAQHSYAAVRFRQGVTSVTAVCVGPSSTFGPTFSRRMPQIYICNFAFFTDCTLSPTFSGRMPQIYM